GLMREVIQQVERIGECFCNHACLYNRYSVSIFNMTQGMRRVNKTRRVPPRVGNPANVPRKTLKLFQFRSRRRYRA
ncbi:hypothetical protein, partial [Paracoccus sp. (in: a-proteobacteria)]|uniref:hypothetical protein n=1 Tax=Paracoccus sp. TaxID=267 RepID=UPI0035AFC015